MDIAIITGASSGMGRELALQLSKSESYDEVWLVARREQRLLELKNELCVPARVFALDLTDPASFELLLSELKKGSYCVKTLCNISGYGKFALTDEISIEDNIGMIELNDIAMVKMCQMTLPFMDGGSGIINFCSLSAFQPVPYMSVYAASKAFALSFSRALGVEVKDRGIHVLSVCPGWVNTPFLKIAALDKSAVTYFDRIYEADFISKKAVEAYKKGKALCVPGLAMKLRTFAINMLPKGVVMKIWMKQQGH